MSPRRASTPFRRAAPGRHDRCGATPGDHRAAGLGALAALCAAALPAVVAAQPRASLSAGVANVRYADTVSMMAATVGPTLRYDSDRASLLASGTYSRLTPESGIASWTSQGALAGSVFTPGLGPLHGELVGRAGLSAHQDGTRTGQWQTSGRAHLMGGRAGLWAGGGVGRTWDGALWRDVRAGDAGAWVRGGAATLVAVATPTSIAVPTGASVRYTDVELSARWAAGRLELGGLLGTRAGDPAATAASDERTWGSGTASLRIAGPIALVGSAGTYPVDFTQGFPGGRYVSLALGLVPRPRAMDRTASTSARAGSGPAADDAAGFRAETLPSGARRLRVRAPSASAVELAGDFSAWEPVPLRRAARGWWEAELPVAAGTYEVGVRIDGGAWDAPAGLVVVVDELGGRAGILVLP